MARHEILLVGLLFSVIDEKGLPSQKDPEADEKESSAHQEVAHDLNQRPTKNMQVLVYFSF